MQKLAKEHIDRLIARFHRELSNQYKLLEEAKTETGKSYREGFYDGLSQAIDMAEIYKVEG